jgi:hypothetical protein
MSLCYCPSYIFSSLSSLYTIITIFTQLNDDYKAKFAFPFILAVKGGAACASRRSQSAHAAACRCSHNPFNFQTNIWFLYRSSVLDEHVLSLRAKCIDMQQKYEAEVATAEDAQSTYERERAQEEVKVTMMKDEAQWMQLQLSAAGKQLIRSYFGENVCTTLLGAERSTCEGEMQ